MAVVFGVAYLAPGVMVGLLGCSSPGPQRDVRFVPANKSCLGMERKRFNFNLVCFIREKKRGMCSV